MIRQTLSALSITLVLGFADEGVAQTLVPNTSSWRFLHPTDGVDPATELEEFHTTFYKMEFDDSKWKEGKDQPGAHGGFGYGDEGSEGVDIGIPEIPDNRKTAYFRLKFTTDQDHENLIFKCQRDDGIIVYLDGEEVMRDNIQRGTLGFRQGKEAYDLFARATISDEKEAEVNSYPLDLRLPAGDHILAISLHNRPYGSSDLRIAEISLSVRSDDESTEQQELDDPVDKLLADFAAAAQDVDVGKAESLFLPPDESEAGSNRRSHIAEIKKDWETPRNDLSVEFTDTRTIVKTTMIFRDGDGEPRSIPVEFVVTFTKQGCKIVAMKYTKPD